MHGVCSLDVLAVEAVDTGVVDGHFVVATDARRKEVYLASYDADATRLHGPLVEHPGAAATDLPVVGEGAILYPDSFPNAVGPVRPSAGWLARVVTGERAELRDPEPLYLRRPDAVAPGKPKPRLVIRAAGRRRHRRDRRAGGGQPRRGRLVRGPGGGRRERPAPDRARTWWPRSTGDVVGHAAASIVADIAELQRIAVDRAHRRTGLATALLEEVRLLAVDGGADRLLLEVREDNAGAIAFYEDQGFAEIARRRLYYRDGATAVVLSLGLERRDGAVSG